MFYAVVNASLNKPKINNLSGSSKGGTEKITYQGLSELTPSRRLYQEGSGGRNKKQDKENNECV
jgi:hypothetical protein